MQLEGKVLIAVVGIVDMFVEVDGADKMIMEFDEEFVSMSFPCI